MSKELYANILKPIPDKFRENRIFNKKELSDAGLAYAYDHKLPDDRFHASLKVRSEYTGMDDVKAYLKAKMPERTDNDFRIWGMTEQSDKSVCCHGDTWSYVISKDEMERLASSHVNETTVMLRTKSFELSDVDADWIAKQCPAYANASTLDSILARYMNHLKRKTLDELIERMEDPYVESGNALCRICEAYAYAEKTGGTVYLEYE